MPLQDTLVIPPVVLIGPVGVGKSTVAGLLADRMGWPHVSMDAVCAGYYTEISVDQAVAQRREHAEGVRVAYQSWKPLEAYAVERILADHQHAVIDLGGGHSVQEDPTLFARVRAALAPVRNVVLLLPSPDSEESVRILTERSAPPEGFDWHRHFVTHPSNGVLAKLVVYTAGQTPSQTCDAVYRRVFRTASGGAPMLGVPVVPEHRQAALGTIGQGVVRVQRAPVAQQQIGPVSPPAEHT